MVGDVRRPGTTAAAVVLGTILAGCGGSGQPAGGPTSTATNRPPSTTAPAPTTTSPAAHPNAAGATSAATAQRRPVHYVFPVRGCSASPSASHHDYPATDIFTQRGCRFVAVVRGRVDEVSRRDRWDPSVDAGATRGGRSVSIVGADGVRYYGSHLLRIAEDVRPGARVRAGQTLGWIDNSGDAKYTPTHVHFGISWPTRAGIWWVRRGEVWPQRYLAAWRDGRDLSPRREVRRTEQRMGTIPPCRVEC